ncbi:hypothetical protein GUITHDRAFT_151694, partial [Guillardia theta CCMP2712]
MAAEEQKDDFKMEDLTDVNKTMSLVVKYLSFVENMSPFKLGQIAEMITKINKDAGEAVAPYFAGGQVVFLLLFVAYFVVSVVALAVDADAMSCPCASESWIWLYALLVISIITFLGFIIFVVQWVLNLINVQIPDSALSLPSPLAMTTFAVLGIILWAGMSEKCDDFYASNHGMLLTVFHIMVIVMSIASVVGLSTFVGQIITDISSYWNQFSSQYLPIGEKKDEDKA